jgi:hypothetical protein
MCEQCTNLQTQIDRYNRHLKGRFDHLTEERMKAAVADLEKRQAEFKCTTGAN